MTALPVGAVTVAACADRALKMPVSLIRRVIGEGAIVMICQKKALEFYTFFRTIPTSFGAVSSVGRAVGF